MSICPETFSFSDLSFTGCPLSPLPFFLFPICRSRSYLSRCRSCLVHVLSFSYLCRSDLCRSSVSVVHASVVLLSFTLPILSFTVVHI